jgi:manganese transport protein
VKKIFAIALGILAAIGGFVDIGDIVFNVQAGAMFGYELLWAVVLGVGGIITYAEMCGRVAAVSERAVFDAVRKRLGFGTGVVALVIAQLVNAMCLMWMIQLVAHRNPPRSSRQGHRAAAPAPAAAND